MQALLLFLWPELLLTAFACLLFLLGAMRSRAVRAIIPVLALLPLAIIFLFTLRGIGSDSASPDITQTVFVDNLALYIKLLAAGVGMLFVFLSWPTDEARSGNVALDLSGDVGEFFALMLLAIAGIFLVASANDIILLFLGIELASIPTYIMVSISRPLPVAQEAGVKYFFLGAMAAALMLFGFSYMYGTTGSTSLAEIRQHFHPGLSDTESAWQLLAVVMLLMGFSFKIAAVPLHSYAGDVYQGAATPVTALLAFVPKTSGMIALIKVLVVAAGPQFNAPEILVKTLFVVAVLTMSFGNVLGLLQTNIKRIFAYSSVAHSGYMLVALTALLAARGMPNADAIQRQSIAAVLFYLCAYGIMNTGAFGILMLIPGRTNTHGRHDSEGHPLPTAGSAETLDDIAGQGHRHVLLALAMTVCCFSLTGLPLTIGFLGKVLLIQPALAIASPSAHHPLGHLMGWLVAITMINAAVSAAYYLKIVAYMFLRPDPSQAATQAGVTPAPAGLLRSVPVTIAVVVSVVGTLFFGIVIPAANFLTNRVASAATNPVATPAATTVDAHAPVAVHVETK